MNAFDSRRPLRVEVDLRSPVSAASYANHVPVISSLVVQNDSDHSEQQVRIVISGPSLSSDFELRLDELGPRESRRFDVIDLPLSHQYLAQLGEKEQSDLTVVAWSETGELCRDTYTLEILAYDQWAGVRSVPELLAAFSQPNNPSVDALLAKAGQILSAEGRSGAISGYPSEERDDVWYQVAAIYNAIVGEHLVYTNPPASFGIEGQKIRLPDRILSGHLGTCLDLTMLFASCLEQANLHPVVLLKEGHSWIGCWLVKSTLPATLTDDCQSIRKRVHNGEMITFETTGVTGSAPINLTTAAKIGQGHLEQDGEFVFGLDIRRARMENILPLPSRWMVGERPQSVSRETLRIDEMPDLPPLLDPSDDFTVAAPENGGAEARLAHWKGKLLDLTTRNRLLNFKNSRTTVPLIVPDAAAVEDALAGGKGWKFRALEEFVPDEDPRSMAIAAARGGAHPYESLARQLMGNSELLSTLPATELTTRLLNIFRASRVGFEESGSNTLFLSIGMLHWRDAVKGRVMAAPILLIPVTLSRRTTRTGFVVTRHDDDTVVNPTLLQLLQDRFQLNLKGLDPLPSDGSGVDVARVLQIFRLAITEVPHWEVRETTFLSLLSYAKYLMWKDLEERPQDLRKNRVVSQLMETVPDTAPVPANDLAERRDIDRRHTSWELLTPLDADSSQLNAISRAAAGHDLVLEGPPGTGKSQTITNLIAHFLGNGKTVLFVSEKMAALDVVHHRLASVGLGPFCLELHSAKAKKAEVLEQMGQALTVSSRYSEAEWLDKGRRLEALRNELNAWVETLHRTHPNGLSLHDAMGRLYRHPHWEPARLSWPNTTVHTVADLQEQRDAVQSVAAVLSDISGPLANHPLSTMTSRTATFAWEDQLSEALGRARAAFRRMHTAVGAVVATIGLSALADGFDSLDALNGVVDVLLRGQSVPQGVLQRIDEPVVAELETWERHGRRYLGAQHALQRWFRDDIATVDGEPLRTAWARAKGQSLVARWLTQRKVLAQLRPYATQPVTADALDTLLATLCELNDEGRRLQAFEDQAHSLLGSELYHGPDTDWEAVAGVRRWVEEFDGAVRHWSRTGTGQDPALRQALTTWVKTEGRGGMAEAMPHLQEYRTAWTEVEAVRRDLRTLSQAPGRDALPASLGALEETLIGWDAAKSEWHLWARWMELRDRLDAFGLETLVTALEEGRIDPKDLEEYWDYSYQYWWFRAVMDTEEPLRNFSRSDRERKITEFRELDRTYQALTAQYLVAKLAAEVARPLSWTSTQEMRILQRELNKKRAHWPVRKLIRSIPTLLPRLKPCLLMSPLSVAQYLDLNARFDVVIFDEASQIPVWDAVGAIARGNQLIVVGDPKQLPPTSFFEAQTDDEPDDDTLVEDLESILDECLASSLPTLRLEWHYRSRHESLIAFSNHRYYDARLVTFPSPVTTDTAVRFQKVDGVYDRGATRTNLKEAESVVEAIAAHFLEHAGEVPTLGVVTFNLAQQRLIEGLLEQKLQRTPELEERINQARESLFVKNLENVQGDERDIIFFSVTYGRDNTGRVALNMGPLNKDGGERRLNVAITRARLGVTIFSTITAEDIDLARTRARGVADLRSYLHYAQHGTVLRGAREMGSRDWQHPIEEGIRARLEEHGWACRSQIGASSHRIDIGVVDPHDDTRFILGIESDGDSYFSLPSARDRDRLHQSVLSDLGWELERVWSIDWLGHSDRELARIETRLQALSRTEEEPVAPTQEPDERFSALNRVDEPDNHPATERIGQHGEFLREYLYAQNLTVVDKTTLGGALWVIGGPELGPLLKPLGTLGVHFIYSPEGGRASRNQPAWWTRDIQ